MYSFVLFLFFFHSIRLLCFCFDPYLRLSTYLLVVPPLLHLPGKKGGISVVRMSCIVLKTGLLLPV